MTSDTRATAAIELPGSMAPLVAGYRWARDTVGLSGDAVYRLHHPENGDDLYLKHGQGSCAVDLAGEMVRLRWLLSNIPVPAVRYFVASPDEAWLLITALPGQSAASRLEAHPDESADIVDALARFLRRLHAIPVESCPFNSDHPLRLGEARWRLDAGEVDVDGFDEERRGWTAERVWDEMTSLLPFPPDPVVTHGDFSLDNIIVENGDVVGCIDVGRAGIADRYQDLAILWHCLRDFGPAAQQRLFASYGINQLDDRKLHFHLMLDELF